MSLYIFKFIKKEVFFVIQNGKAHIDCLEIVDPVNCELDTMWTSSTYKYDIQQAQNSCSISPYNPFPCHSSSYFKH